MRAVVLARPRAAGSRNGTRTPMPAGAPGRAIRRRAPAPRRRWRSVRMSENWFLLNASPDLRQQIAASAFLHPRHGLRSSPIAGVVLTGGDVDAIAGLLTLRERQPFTVYATARIHAVLDANPIFDVLARDIVARQVVPVGQPVAAGPARRRRQRADARTVPRSRQGAALSRTPGRDAGDRRERRHRRRGDQRWRAPAVLHPRLRRDDRPSSPAGCAAPMRCSSTARCGATTK